MNCKERLTMRTTEGACMIIHADNEIEAEQEFCDKFKLMCNKLAELEDKLENGTLIDVPCKVGDIAYSYKKCFYLPHATRIKPNAIITCEIIVIKQTKKGIHLLLKPLLDETFGKRSANMWFSLTSIGKTVFLTKEEAEARLKELKND